jgi:hypothetical protein
MIKYDMVFIPKGRKKALFGQGNRVNEVSTNRLCSLVISKN